VNYLGAFSVQSDQIKQHEILQKLALHDPLTGLPNRLFLEELGERALRQAEQAAHPLPVLLIDVDRFYLSNNSLGHDVGDQILLAVSQRLRCALQADDVLAHFGGDRFILVLAGMRRRDEVASVAQNILCAIEAPIEVAGHRLKMTASIGISFQALGGSQFDDLLIEAERAMLVAKQAGGNLYRFYSAEMVPATVEQLEMEARLDAAICNGELRLYFQPKLDLDSRTIIGAEALVRWLDPQVGLVPPGHFIPIAERSDLIAKIGSWVLDQTCSALVRWADSLPAHFHVAVNVSPMQFARTNLVDEVRTALKTHGTPASRLQIEVTESLFIRDERDVSKMLNAIAALGVSVALDDFGTGYSSISSLSRLPFDTFKLDQRFVRGVDADPTNSVIAKAVLHLADGLGKKVVAEGIETCAECQKVKTLGYRIGQGYKFAKPLCEEEFIRYLKQWQPSECNCPASEDGHNADVWLYGHA